MIYFAKYIHLLSLVVWLGAMTFFSFIGAPAIFKTLDRSTAGDVVAVIFPKYYAIGYVCSILAILTLAFIVSKTGITSASKAGLITLVVMFILTLGSGLVVAPKVKNIKEQIRQTTDTAKSEALNTEFKKLHGISMALNGVTWIVGLVLLYFTVGYMSPATLE